MIGKAHQGELLTLSERRSRLSLALPIPRKTAKHAKDATIQLLKPLKNYVHTITYDNARGFCKHENVAQSLACDSYFAKPYHSWERELNENTNGFLRQYFPKKSSLKNITGKQVMEATDKLNNRPRKCLGYKTPIEVFGEWSGDSSLINQFVAIMG